MRTGSCCIVYDSCVQKSPKHIITVLNFACWFRLIVLCMFLGLAVCVFLCYSLDHLFQRCLLLLCWVFVSSVPSQEIGWEAHLNMTYSMSSGT